jgi:hypothetical protein
VNRKSFWPTVRLVAVFVLVVGAGALAQAPKQRHFSGLINDYTPETGGGPWEMRGIWSLTLSPQRGTADFLGAMNMTHSDYWVVLNPGAANDDSAITGRHPHTHHITMKGAALIENANGCTIEVMGKASITADGGFPPFDPTGANPSPLVVCVTGGTEVQYSNVTLTFSSPASGHFGPQAIHGFVRRGGLGKDDLKELRDADFGR